MVATGGATRSRDDDPPGRPPPKNPARKIWNNFRAPGPVGSGYGDLPSPLLKLTIARQNQKRAWARFARRSTVETCLLGGRAIKIGRVRAHAGMPNMCPGTKQDKTGEIRGEVQARRQERKLFPLYVCLGPPPTYPRGDGGP
jgi:hypothetical protein